MLRRYARVVSAMVLSGMVALACSLESLSSQYHAAEGGRGDAAPAPVEEDVDASPRAAPSCMHTTPAPTFCDDFDHGIDERWSPLLKGDGGVSNLDQALVVSIPGASKRPGAAAALWKEFPQTATSAHLTFYFRAPVPMGTTEQPIITFELERSRKAYQLSLMFSDSETRVSERQLGADAGTPQNYPVKTQIPTGGVSVSMEFSLGKRPRLVLSFNEVEVLDKVLTLPFTPGPNLRLYIGVIQAEVPTDPWSVHFDDVHVLVE
ncbi:hypothetical protein LZC95_38650 [Pendulispora brunnea]|uniref:Uncharacterized protein n=1 Tax=Pendulispora brunnea TaxID=2905690 RepID=A0ABZ2K6D4_9BACT